MAETTTARTNPTNAAPARIASAAVCLLAVGLFTVGVRGSTLDDASAADPLETVEVGASAGEVAGAPAPGEPRGPVAAGPATDPADTATTSTAPTVPATTATTAPAARGVVTTAPRTATAPTAPAPTLPVPRIAPAAGRYPVSVAGTAALNGNRQDVAPTGTLAIEPVPGGDQRQRTPGASGDAVAVLRYSAGGAQLVSLELKAGGITKTLTPNPPARYLAFGAPSGTTWTWQATTTDGKTTIDGAGRAGATDTVTVAGTAVAVDVVETTLTLSGDVTGTVRLTTWVAKDSRLPVRQHQVIDARVRSIIPLRYTADTTTALTSLTPA